ncbi:hypothetical protein JXB01_01265 [Candidatus Micrarchaeota archaeon]|nr:hypothetical protein [Candidatus Micrarchaeota archaeon]
MRRILLLSAVLMVLSGCVTETEFSSVSKESAADFQSFDFDGNGIVDAYSYISNTYSPEGTSVTLQRTVLASAERESSGISFENISFTNAQEIKMEYNNLVESSQEEFDVCSSKLGLQNVQCPDENTCVKICSSYSPVCRRVSEDYPDILGPSILSFQKNKIDSVNKIDSMKNKIFSVEMLSPAQLEDLADDLVDLKNSITALYTNPLYLVEGPAICTYSETPLKILDQMSEKIAGISTIDKEYEYTVLIRIQNKDNKQSYEDIFVKDVVPAEYTSGSLYSTQNIKIEGDAVFWDAVRPYGDETRYAVYTFKSSTPPQDIAWNKASVKIKSLDLSILAFSFSVFDFFIISGDYYLSLSMAVLLPAVIFVVIINILLFAFFYLRAKLEKKSQYRAVKDFVGVTNPNWRKDIIFGAVLFLVGSGLSFFTAVTDGELVIPNAINYILTDYVGLISTFCIVFGGVTVYLGLQSKIKEMLLQSTYRVTIQEDKEAALSNLADLKEKSAELKKFIDELSKEEFDISDAYRVYTSIPLKKINTLAEKKDTSENVEVMKLLNMVENAVELLKEKKENAEQSWQSWENYISKQLEDKEDLYVSTLITIPSSLRLWAVNRYIQKHLEEGLALEGELIRKKTLSPEAMTAALIKEGLIKGAVVLKDSKPVLSLLSAGSKNITTALTIKLISYLKTFLKKRNQKEYKYLMGIGNSNAFILVKSGETESLILCEKGKFKEAFERWKQTLKRF